MSARSASPRPSDGAGGAGPRGRAPALLVAAGVVALGAYGVLFQARLPARLPSPTDWHSAAALLARDARPGDAVALAPWWAERAREVLPGTVPVLAFPRLAGEDLAGIRRVWLVALPDAPGYRGATGEDLAARAAAVEGPQRLGALAVTRFELRDPLLPLADLVERLGAAAVSVGGRPCSPGARGAFRCPGPSAVAVAREIREVDLLPRRCVVAQPSPDPAAPLAIAIPGVRIGTRLRGHVASVAGAAREGAPPVRLAVAVDGRELGVVEAAAAAPGWRPFELDTLRDAGQTATVRLTVTAPGASRPPLCFDAYTLP